MYSTASLVFTRTSSSLYYCSDHTTTFIGSCRTLILFSLQHQYPVICTLCSSGKVAKYINMHKALVLPSSLFYSPLHFHYNKLLGTFPVSADCLFPTVLFPVKKLKWRREQERPPTLCFSAPSVSWNKISVKAPQTTHSSGFLSHFSSCRF